MYAKPNVFISACITFDECRFDGTSISDETVKRLTPFINVIKACPEMAIGLSSPRDSLRLIEEKGKETQLVVGKTGEDYTKRMADYSDNYLMKLKDKQLDGFILKAKSPSCGIRNVRKYYGIGKAHSKGSSYAGMFGGRVLELFPGIPIENERRLSNFNLRETFYISIFTLAAFRDMKETNKYKEFVAFHSNNKYLFMSYHQGLLKKMGNIVANHEKRPFPEVLDLYEELLRELLSKEPTLKRRINVLTHIYGYFKDRISASEKEFYFDLLDQYLNHHVPYRVLLDILNGFVIRFDESYLMNQTIFHPYPKELVVMMDSGKKV